MFRQTCILAIAILSHPWTAYPQTGDLREDVLQLAIRHRTEHYELAGTIAEDRFSEYGRCLEYIYKEYAAGFGELLAKPAARAAKGPAESPEKPDERFKVVIFATENDYEEFSARYFAERAEHTRGLYVPSVQLLLIRDEALSSETYEVLFHEAFHQFMHRHVAAAPIWVNEGLATHYGTARATPSGLVFERTRSDYCDVVASGATAGKLIPLAELMAADPAAFYSRNLVDGLSVDHTTLSYAQSYTLVAFMLADPHGKEHLRKYLRDLAAAPTAAEAGAVTRKHFPETLLTALVPDWQRFVNRN